MKNALIYLIFMLLACSSAFALTVLDLKPNDRVRDLHILASHPFYKEEASSVLLIQPFFSYEDVDAHIFIYDSPRGNAPKGYDLMVIFEDWKSETKAKNRFERDFSFEAGFQECSMEFSRRFKKCEKLSYPQLIYVSYYQNFLIRIQPHSDHPFTTEDLFYLSFDMQKLVKNILSKISKLEEEITPTEEEITLAKKETTPTELSPTEEKRVPEEEAGFFSRNKYYILGGIGLLLIILWMYKTKSLLKNIFIIILGLIIFNRYTILTRKETISLALLWTITYFLIKWFYIKNIKKKEKKK